MTWTGGREHGDRSANLIDGIDDQDEVGPTQPAWWHQLLLRIMDAMESPDPIRTIGVDRHG